MALLRSDSFIFLLIALSFFLTPVLLMTGSPSFVRTYHGQTAQTVPLSVEMPNGDLILVTNGDFLKLEQNETNVMVYCLDAKGNQKWSLRLGSGVIDYHFSLTFNSAGHIVILLRAQITTGNEGILLLVLDQNNGLVLLSKVYYYNGLQISRLSLATTSDGGYIISAGVFTSTNSETRIMLFKVNSQGNTAWAFRSNIHQSKIYIGEVIVAPNGDIILGGSANKPNSGIYDAYLLKVSNEGVVQWLKTYGLSLSSLAPYQFTLTNDGYLWAVIMTEGTESSLFITKLNFDGNLISSKKYEALPGEYVMDMVVDTEGNIILLTSQVLIQGQQMGKIFLIKLSSSLEIITKRNYETGVVGYPYKITVLSDGGYLVSGTLEDPNSPNPHSPYLAKFEKEDFKVCGSLTEISVTTSSTSSDAGVIDTPLTADQFTLRSYTLQETSVALQTNSFLFVNLRQNEDLCQIYDVSYYSAQTQATPDNECGCTENGTCDPETLDCSCSQLYTGEECQLLKSEMQSLISTTTSAISNLVSNYQSMTPDEALTQAEYLTATPELVTIDSFNSLSQMLMDITLPGAPISDQTLQKAFDLQSSLCCVKPQAQVGQLQVTNTITSTTSQIIEAKLASNLVVQTDKIKVRVDDVNPSQPTLLSPSTDFGVQISPGSSQCGGTPKLVVAEYTAISYAGLSGDNYFKDSPVCSVDLFCDGVKQVVKDLAVPNKLEFLVNSAKGKEILAKIKAGLITEQQAIDAGFFECRYYDEGKNKLSIEGCKVVRITETSIICECNHLTSFLSFFNKGAEVLQESNYDVWLAIPLITLSSLKTNVGFYIACTYWGLWLLLGILSMGADNKHFKGIGFLKLLYQISHPDSQNEASADQTIDSDASFYHEEKIDGNA